MKHLLEYEEFKELYQLNDGAISGGALGAVGGAITGAGAGLVGGGIHKVYQNYKEKKKLKSQGKDVSDFKITKGAGGSALKGGAIGAIGGGVLGGAKGAVSGAVDGYMNKYRKLLSQ